MTVHSAQIRHGTVLPSDRTHDVTTSATALTPNSENRQADMLILHVGFLISSTSTATVPYPAGGNHEPWHPQETPRPLPAGESAVLMPTLNAVYVGRHHSIDNRKNEVIISGAARRHRERVTQPVTLPCGSVVAGLS